MSADNGIRARKTTTACTGRRGSATGSAAPRCGCRSGPFSSPRTQSPADLCQGPPEIVKQQIVRAIEDGSPGNQHIVNIRTGLISDQVPRRSPHAPPCPIPFHGIAHLTARSEAYPDTGTGRLCMCGLQNKPCRHSLAAASGNPDELPPSGQANGISRGRASHGCPVTRRRAACGQADRRVRPFARRARSILRPPTVDIRLRKPCRRFRTRTLG